MIAALLVLAALAAAPAPVVDVRVVAADRGAEPAARELSRDARFRVLRASAFLDLDPPPRVTVVVASTAPRNGDEARALDLAGVPYWAAGLAQPARGRIVLFLDRLGVGTHENLPGVLVHEAVHLVLGTQLADPGALPRWYDEGLAMVAERGVSLRDAWELARLVVAGDPLPLDAFARDWPRTGAESRAAYAESLSFVSYAEAATSRGAPRRLVEALREGADFERAFTIAYGIDRHRLEADWRATLHDRYVAYVILFGGVVANVALGVFAAWALVHGRRARRLRLASYDEPPEDPGHDEWIESRPDDT